MKLLFVHERFGAFAGAEANILATAGELKQRGHVAGLLHGPSTGQGLPGWRKTFRPAFPFGTSEGAVDAGEAVETFQPDVIYAHKLANLDVIETLLASGAPLVRMVHDHDLYCMRSYKYNYFTRAICRRPASRFCVAPCGAFVARQRGGRFPLRWVSYSSKLREIRLNREFDRLIVASQYMKQELLRNGFDPRRIEIHPPVPPENGSAPRSNFSDRNLILYSGQIIRGKGVDVLLRSLARVQEPFECLIFGGGNHRPHCERLSRKLGLANRVRFMGCVPADELGLFYRQCTVLAVSSLWPEPFGAAGLEAMRCAVPVVAFDAGAIREWLQDGYNGFLVPWGDCAAFAARVGTLLRDKALAWRLGEQGRRMVAGQYPFARYIDGLEELFGRLALKNRELVAA